jgi:hypothetical protein
MNTQVQARTTALVAGLLLTWLVNAVAADTVDAAAASIAPQPPADAPPATAKP